MQKSFSRYAPCSTRFFSTACNLYKAPPSLNMGHASDPCVEAFSQYAPYFTVISHCSNSRLIFDSYLLRLLTRRSLSALHLSFHFHNPSISHPLTFPKPFHFHNPSISPSSPTFSYLTFLSSSPPSSFIPSEHTPKHHYLHSKPLDITTPWLELEILTDQIGSVLANLPLLLDRLLHHLVQDHHHQPLHPLSLTLYLILVQKLNGRGVKFYQLFVFI